MKTQQMELVAERLRARTANRRWLETFHDRVFGLPEAKGCDYVVVTESPPAELRFFGTLPNVESFIRSDLDNATRDVAVYRYRGASDAILML